MAFQWVDGFDHYTDITNVYAVSSGNITVTLGSSFGRFSSNGVRLSNSSTSFFDIDLAAYGGGGSTLIFGIAWNPTILPTVSTQTCFDFKELATGASQIDIRMLLDGTLQVTRGGTVLASSTNKMIANQYRYLEFKFTIHASAGSIELRIDGTSSGWIPATTGLNTKGASTSTTTVDRIIPQASNGNSYLPNFDDLYVADTTGSTNNDFQGDVRVYTSFPTSAGNYQQFGTLVGAASHTAAVNETAPNSDTSYIADGTLNDMETFNVTDLATTAGNIQSVRVLCWARKDDAGSRVYRNMCRSAGTDSVGSTDQNAAAGYVYSYQNFDIDPATGVAWTISGFNAAEFGLKITG